MRGNLLIAIRVTIDTRDVLPDGAARRGLRNGILEERPDNDGSFDELVGGLVHMHLETMDDGCPWMSFYESEKAEDSVTVWVRAENGRTLSVRLYEDE